MNFHLKVASVQRLNFISKIKVRLYNPQLDLPATNRVWLPDVEGAAKAQMA